MWRGARAMRSESSLSGRAARTVVTFWPCTTSSYRVGWPSVALPLLQVVRVDVLEADVPDVALAHQRHRRIDLFVDDGDRARHARFTTGAEAIVHRAAHKRALGTQRQGLQHVLAGTDA